MLRSQIHKLKLLVGEHSHCLWANNSLHPVALKCFLSIVLASELTFVFLIIPNAFSILPRNTVIVSYGNEFLCHSYIYECLLVEHLYVKDQVYLKLEYNFHLLFTDAFIATYISVGYVWLSRDIKIYDGRSVYVSSLKLLHSNAGVRGS
jgi:hypothetical protein